MSITRRGFLAASSFVLGTLSSCAAPASMQKELSTTVFCFDTVCQLRGVMDQEVLDGAVALCERFEQLFSRTIATSDVARINDAGAEPVMVEPETADLISQALGYCEASGGLFDITIGAVSSLWDFRNGIVPSEEDIAAALPHVGWRTVHVDGTAVRLDDPAASLDLGGIAKGWIADALISYLAGEGVESACVNLGGNVVVLGSKPDGSPWRVGVQDPFAERGASIIARTDIADGSLVTSGLYERAFEQGGRRYWHILDPRTGYPVETGIVSASVLSERSIDGDGFTKQLFFNDPKAGLADLEGRSLHGLVVCDDGTILTTPDAPFTIL